MDPSIGTMDVAPLSNYLEYQVGQNDLFNIELNPEGLEPPSKRRRSSKLALPKGWLKREWIAWACTCSHPSGKVYFVDNVIQKPDLYAWIRDSFYPDLSPVQYRTAVKRVLESTPSDRRGGGNGLDPRLEKLLLGTIRQVGKNRWAASIVGSSSQPDQSKYEIKRTEPSTFGDEMASFEKPGLIQPTDAQSMSRKQNHEIARRLSPVGQSDEPLCLETTSLEQVDDLTLDMLSQDIFPPTPDSATVSTVFSLEPPHPVEEKPLAPIQGRGDNNLSNIFGTDTAEETIVQQGTVYQRISSAFAVGKAFISKLFPSYIGTTPLHGNESQGYLDRVLDLLDENFKKVFRQQAETKKRKRKTSDLSSRIRVIETEISHRYQGRPFGFAVFRSRKDYVYCNSYFVRALGGNPVDQPWSLLSYRDMFNFVQAFIWRALGHNQYKNITFHGPADGTATIEMKNMTIQPYDSNLPRLQVTGYMRYETRLGMFIVYGGHHQYYQ